MRNLFMLVGAPASGKSTLVKNLELQNYTIEADEIRKIVSNPTTQLIESSPYRVNKVINYQDESFTWKLIYDIMERRMQQGESIIMDSTHLYKGAFGKELILAKKYNYQVVAIDMMRDISVEHDISDSENYVKDIVDKLSIFDYSRGNKIGDKDVLERYTRRYLELVDRNYNNLHVINPSDFYSMINDGVIDAKQNKPYKPYTDFNEFNKVNIIGDVHGDYASLMKVFDNHERGDAYVFVGDYLDRGTKNVETFKFLMKLKGKNIFFIRGNHELNAEKFVTEGKAKGQFGHTTLAQLMRAGITKEDLASFQERLVDVVKFEFNDKLYIVTHAGVEAQRVNSINVMTDESELVMGLSSKEHSPYDIDVDKRYASPYLYNESNGKANYLPRNFPVNIHGHRNTFNTPPLTADVNYSWNLTDDKDFRYMTLHKGKNATTYYSGERIDSPSLVQKMIEDDGVRQKQVDGTDIVAHNFTKEVFFSAHGKRWTPQSLQARGFFTRGDSIVGRGFTKFFNIGETPDSTLSSLVYPVKVFKKYNGFLAIAFFDSTIGKLRMVTKSGGTSLPNVDDNNLIKNVIESTSTEHDGVSMYDKLYQYLKSHPYQSIALEIISTKDPHIIKYTSDVAKPLAVIDNETGDFDKIGESLFDISPLAVADNQQELQDFLDNNSDGYTNEGFVLRGQNKQLKLKTPYYLKAKELRGRLELFRDKGEKKFRESGYLKESKWYYGAHDWFKRSIRNGDIFFTPDLAIKLYKEDIQKQS